MVVNSLRTKRTQYSWGGVFRHRSPLQLNELRSVLGFNPRSKPKLCIAEAQAILSHVLETAPTPRSISKEPIPAGCVGAHAQQRNHEVTLVSVPLPSGTPLFVVSTTVLSMEPNCCHASNKGHSTSTCSTPDWKEPHERRFFFSERSLVSGKWRSTVVG